MKFPLLNTQRSLKEPHISMSQSGSIGIHMRGRTGKKSETVSVDGVGGHHSPTWCGTGEGVRVQPPHYCPVECKRSRSSVVWGASSLPCTETEPSSIRGNTINSPTVMVAVKCKETVLHTCEPGSSLIHHHHTPQTMVVVAQDHGNLDTVGTPLTTPCYPEVNFYKSDTPLHSNPGGTSSAGKQNQTMP